MASITAAEKQLILAFWCKVDVEALGGDTLTCMFIVFPWIRRLFSNLDDPLQPSLSLGTSPLRELLCNKLHVDPINFRLQGEVLITLLAADFGKELTPAYHHAFHKLVGVVAHALACRSH
uniref:Globin domain-containing protein n=1 Tax=Podarcis muralis TaxID=64176 RepID=A0A670ID43_PODMU